MGPLSAGGSDWNVSLTPGTILDDFEEPKPMTPRPGKGNPDAIHPGGYQATLPVGRDVSDGWSDRDESYSSATGRRTDPSRSSAYGINHTEDAVIAAYDAKRATTATRAELGDDLCSKIDRGMKIAEKRYRDIRLAALNDAAESITRNQRDALSLVYWTGLGPAAAAARLGLSKQAMHDRCLKARRALRGIFAVTECLIERGFTVPHRVEASSSMTLTEKGRIPVKQFYTIPQAAAAGHISVPTLYRRWKEGTGPASVWQGGKRLVPDAALDSWLDKLPGA